MTKADLVERVSDKIKLNKKEAEAVINALFSSISDSLAEGGKVEIRGFGSFHIRERNARTGRNPRSGEKVDVPAKKVPFFTAGKDLKTMVDREVV